MMVHTQLAQGYWLRKCLLAVMCILLGGWAVYDGYYKLPAQQQRWADYQEYQALRDQKATGRISAGDLARHDELAAQVPDTEPKERSDADVILQRGLAAIAFLVALAVVLTWLLSARRKFEYNDEGTLTTPEGAFTRDQITGIDLTRWMSKSIAIVEINGGPQKEGGTAVKLDAWIYAGLEDVITELRQRFHPEDDGNKESTESGEDEGASKDDQTSAA